jgi:hypothetical protein
VVAGFTVGVLVEAVTITSLSGPGLGLTFLMHRDGLQAIGPLRPQFIELREGGAAHIFYA